VNDKAREALVQAALQGTRQITGAFRDDDDGRCALGVLYDAMGVEFPTVCMSVELREQLCITYDISNDEGSDIVNANDILKWDFLTIARKIGNIDESA